MHAVRTNMIKFLFYFSDNLFTTFMLLKNVEMKNFKARSCAISQLATRQLSINI